MNRIYKYDFGPLSPGIKTITIDNEVNYLLDIQEQYGNLVAWVSVSDSIKPCTFGVDVRWTGEVAPDKRYITTIQGSDGLVYHIYL